MAAWDDDHKAREKAEEMRLRLEGEETALRGLNKSVGLNMTPEEIIRIIVRRHKTTQECLSKLKRDPVGTIKEWGI